MSYTENIQQNGIKGEIEIKEEFDAEFSLKNNSEIKEATEGKSIIKEKTEFKYVNEPIEIKEEFDGGALLSKNSEDNSENYNEKDNIQEKIELKCAAEMNDEIDIKVEFDGEALLKNGNTNEKPKTLENTDLKCIGKNIEEIEIKKEFDEEEFFEKNIEDKHPDSNKQKKYNKRKQDFSNLFSERSGKRIIKPSLKFEESSFSFPNQNKILEQQNIEKQNNKYLDQIFKKQEIEKTDHKNGGLIAKGPNKLNQNFIFIEALQKYFPYNDNFFPKTKKRVVSNYECETCGKTFITRKECIEHITTVHEGLNNEQTSKLSEENALDETDKTQNVSSLSVQKSDKRFIKLQNKKDLTNESISKRTNKTINNEDSDSDWDDSYARRIFSKKKQKIQPRPANEFKCLLNLNKQKIDGNFQPICFDGFEIHHGNVEHHIKYDHIDITKKFKCDKCEINKDGGDDIKKDISTEELIDNYNNKCETKTCGKPPRYYATKASLERCI